ncbi:innexin inx2-like isoform X1 [Tigriopus californicus]|uniref:innexin inx2-like isoform X1 n=1 Tax=Tigriopus californicus TaxID=6832 RepID=UPI0027D9D5E8|nr:innexin inx2-like isoform X1 [Tigriopus californicus]|eukprot:TCALIF_08527-PA protein Name:"Similar to Inx2 Innexin inx2 (Drosophila melanogaster)" AED:0.26 eAED:0.26 QI:557/0.66/0.5/1/1/1/4/78/479
MAAAIGIAKTATEIFLGVGEISIDNLTFKLYYKWTVTMFIVSSVLVSTSQFFGEPIQCETAEDSVDDDVLNAFCWMYSSFDIPPNFEGICTRREHDGSRLYNSYYQWVSIFLGSQAVLFYIPRCIWLMLEGGLMSYIVKGTTGRVVDDADEKMGRMLRQFQEHIHNKFNRYAFGFFACEFMNLVIAVMSIYSTHKFLNGQFLTYGLLVYRYYSLPPEERELTSTYDPMCELFPKQVGCYYSRFGLGGGLDSRHGMCILGLNMINDKVFLLIWIWHYVLIITSIVRVTTRTMQISSSKIRFFLMKLKMSKYFKKNAHLIHIMHYIHNCSIGDWFVLYQMSKNLNKRFFAEFLALLAMTVDPDPSIEPEEPEIHLSPEEIEKLRDYSSSNDSSSRKRSGAGSDASDDDPTDGSDDDSGGSKKSSFIMNIGDDLDTDGDGGGGGGGGLSGKQRMLIKMGKKAKSANKSAMMAAAAMKRARRK